MSSIDETCPLFNDDTLFNDNPLPIFELPTFWEDSFSSLFPHLEESNKIPTYIPSHKLEESDAFDNSLPAPLQPEHSEYLLTEMQQELLNPDMPLFDIETIGLHEMDEEPLQSKVVFPQNSLRLSMYEKYGKHRDWQPSPDVNVPTEIGKMRKMVAQYEQSDFHLYSSLSLRVSLTPQDNRVNTSNVSLGLTAKDTPGALLLEFDLKVDQIVSFFILTQWIKKTQSPIYNFKISLNVNGVLFDIVNQPLQLRNHNFESRKREKLADDNANPKKKLKHY